MINSQWQNQSESPKCLGVWLQSQKSTDIDESECRKNLYHEAFQEKLEDISSYTQINQSDDKFSFKFKKKTMSPKVVSYRTIKKQSDQFQFKVFFHLEGKIIERNSSSEPNIGLSVSKINLIKNSINKFKIIGNLEQNELQKKLLFQKQQKQIQKVIYFQQLLHFQKYIQNQCF